MTGAEIMAAVGFIVMLFGALTGAFWKMWGLISDAAKKGEQAQYDLAAYKLHVAETFATKAGMQEQTVQLMRAIESIGRRIDGLTERIDNLMQPKTRSRT